MKSIDLGKIAAYFDGRLMSQTRAGVKGVSQEELNIRDGYKQLLSALKHCGAEEKSSDENYVNSVDHSQESIPSQALCKEGVTTRDVVPILGNGIVCSA